MEFVYFKKKKTTTTNGKKETTERNCCSLVEPNFDAYLMKLLQKTSFCKIILRTKKGYHFKKC